MIKLIILLLGLTQVTDVIATRQLLETGLFEEINPVANYIISNFGYFCLLLFKLLPIIFLFFYVQDKITKIYQYVLLSSVLGVYITLNIYQIYFIITI